MFLLGPPGPRRRHLALQFCELTGREVEYLALSRDTTEADIKVCARGLRWMVGFSAQGYHTGIVG